MAVQVKSQKWFQRFSDRWNHEKDTALGALQNVSISELFGVAKIQGEFRLKIEDGSCYGPFLIEIVYPHDFPSSYGAPSIYLKNNPCGWENVADSHIESDWKLCLGVPVELGIDFRQRGSLQKLLEKTGAFFVLQLQFQRALFQERIGGPKAKWPGKDRGHGIKGIAQAAKKWKLSRDGNQKCLCGSIKKFKKCCGPKLAAQGYWSWKSNSLKQK